MVRRLAMTLLGPAVRALLSPKQVLDVMVLTESEFRSKKSLILRSGQRGRHPHGMRIRRPRATAEGASDWDH
jgi:hypothetical protein